MHEAKLLKYKRVSWILNFSLLFLPFFFFFFLLFSSLRSTLQGCLTFFGRKFGSLIEFARDGLPLNITLLGRDIAQSSSLFIFVTVLGFLFFLVLCFTFAPPVCAVLLDLWWHILLDLLLGLLLWLEGSAFGWL